MWEHAVEVIVCAVLVAFAWQNLKRAKEAKALRKDWDTGLRELAELLSEAASWREARSALKKYEPRQG